MKATPEEPTGVEFSEPAPPKKDEHHQRIENWAKAQLAGDAPKKPVPAPPGIAEEQIAEKVKAGVSREQAIAVIQEQRRNDAALAASEQEAANIRKEAQSCA